MLECFWILLHQPATIQSCLFHLLIILFFDEFSIDAADYGFIKPAKRDDYFSALHVWNSVLNIILKTQLNNLCFRGLKNLFYKNWWEKTKMTDKKISLLDY